MKNFLLFSALICILIVITIGIYLTASKSPARTQENTSNQIENQTSSQNTQGYSKKAEGSDSSSSRYVEYNQSNLSNSASTRRVLFFFANWCPICKPADQNFKANLDKIPEDVTVIRVNYNDSDTDQAEKDLAKKYGVTYQHTFVQIDQSGNEVTIWNGGKIDELLKNLK